MSWLKLDLGEKVTSIALTQVKIMLLEFTVENYRSIKEPVTLSAVAQKAPKRKTSAKTKRGVKSDAEICPGFPVEGWDMELVPVMAIFGANASGKSNLINALDYLLSLMNGRSEKGKSYLFPVSHSPFGLDNLSREQATKFDLHITQAGSIYRYHLEVLGRKVHREVLEYLPSTTKRSRQLFHREWSDDLSSYTWKNGDMFSGAHIHLEETLSKYELFISLVKRLKLSIIQPLAEFLEGYWGYGSTMPVIRVENLLSAPILRELCIEKPAFKSNIVKVLSQFDTGIIDIEFHKPRQISDSGIYAIHKTESGERIEWEFEEESLGTQRLFGFTYAMISTLELGGVMSIDELGSNLHPKITAYIIQLFQNPKTNPKGAQLIFTSHDNTLQRNQLLRRDEIWFTEKKPDQSTDLYSLADFKVRNDLAIDKAYLDGRFGAVPFLPETVEELLGVD
jgi:uncharacterized protein